MVKKNEIATGFDIKSFVSHARGDIAFANPVAFLLRAMSGEAFPLEGGDMEILSLRDRTEIAKYLVKFVMPVADAEEIGATGAKYATPPPLTIIMNNNTPVVVERQDSDGPNDHVKIKPQVIDV